MKDYSVKYVTRVRIDRVWDGFTRPLRLRATQWAYIVVQQCASEAEAHKRAERHIAQMNLPRPDWLVGLIKSDQTDDPIGVIANIEPTDLMEALRAARFSEPLDPQSSSTQSQRISSASSDQLQSDSVPRHQVRPSS